MRPQLLVFIDAEEEFEWTRFSSSETSIRNIAEQYRAQDILESAGCVPTYLVDYPVVSQTQGSALLRDWVKADRCRIGAQLHPWVTPPLVHETITPPLTFAGNLEPEIERAKLTRLTDAIRDVFELQPRIYRAGRYGIGPHSVDILQSLGYRIDVSVLAGMNFRRSGGPSFVGHDVIPYWLDRDHGLLEIPLTNAYLGGLSRFGAALYPYIDAPFGRLLHSPAILARTGLLNRVRLSPEGQPLDEAMRLTSALLKRGVRLFSLNYHSSSLLPGGNPYVQSAGDVQAMLDWLTAYLDFFMNRLNGQPADPWEIYRHALALSPSASEMEHPDLRP